MVRVRITFIIGLYDVSYEFCLRLCCAQVDYHYTPVCRCIFAASVGAHLDAHYAVVFGDGLAACQV